MESGCWFFLRKFENHTNQIISGINKVHRIINPSSPGFESVVIRPNPCGLKNIRAEMPTPLGLIKASFNFTDDGGIKGSIVLPEKMTGEFIWNNEIMRLQPGENTLSQILIP